MAARSHIAAPLGLARKVALPSHPKTPRRGEKMKISITAAYKKQRQLEAENPQIEFFIMAAQKLPVFNCPRCGHETAPCFLDERTPHNLSFVCLRCKHAFPCPDDQIEIVAKEGEKLARAYADPPF